MSKNPKGRWSERTRMLVTLELAIVLPAAALIGFSVWNLRSIQRDRAVEAAIQRDFSYLLKITEKRANERARNMVKAARADFPCPTEKNIGGKLEHILEAHPEFSHVFLFDGKTNSLIGRSQPNRPDGPDINAEGDQFFATAAVWMPQEGKDIVEKLHAMEEKDGAPFLAFFPNTPKREGQRAYELVSYFLPPELPEGRVAIAGVVFDADYLRGDFFPGIIQQILAKESEAGGKNVPVMMLRIKREDKPLVASAGWDAGKPEVERSLEDVFGQLVLYVKYRGTTIEAISDHFLRDSFLILGGLSLILSFGIWHTYRNVSREMAVARLKSDFVANVSHELRTPLALIRLYAETLELGRVSTPEKQQEYYRIVRKESERLSALINNILDFSRIEAGRKEYDFRETNLAELVRQTLESYRYQIEQNGFSFEERIADDLPPVQVDREAIARSLLNLINNAIKYSNTEKYLGVNLYRANGDVRLEVIDHGIGIPRNEQPKIFEKFYRVGDPLVHNTKGSGLGLSLVRHIVQAHGGNVTVESIPGKGSKFTIALPVEPQRAAAVN